MTSMCNRGRRVFARMSYNNVVNCPCSGVAPVGVGTVGTQAATLSALSAFPRSADPALAGGAALAAGGVTPAVASAYTPAVQIQQFEPAFYTPCPVFTMIPYAPSVVSAVAPVFPASTSTAATGTTTLAAGGVIPPSATPTPGFRANSCGCCPTAYSPLPPNGFAAWQGLIRRSNAPYEQLMGGSCGGYGPFYA